ncbi:MAG TPA: PKD domain-containing protein, partial [Methanoregulaceae archaeon]|nr:PKD domain-containing protein [Methanoregulaceae archaeon]
MKTFRYIIGAILLISLVLIPASASTLTIESGYAQNSGDTINLSIILDEAPEGLAGFNITCEVTNPQILDISSVSFPAWAGIPNTSVLPSDTCWLAAADAGYQINPGDTDILLATLTVTGTQFGTTDIRVTAWKVQNEQGSNMQVTTRNSTVTIGVLQPPIAAFSSSPDSGPTPLTVQFTDQSTGVVTGWWWDFGDGTYSAAINPEHEFGNPGDYYVYLTASNDAGSRQAGQVIHVTGDTKEFIRVLGDGWNILSTPVLLDGENSTFPAIFDQ